MCVCVVVQTKINIHGGWRSASSPPWQAAARGVLRVHTRGRKRGERDVTRLPLLTSSPFLKRAIAHHPLSPIPSIERNPWSVRGVVVCHQPLAPRLHHPNPLSSNVHAAPRVILPSPHKPPIARPAPSSINPRAACLMYAPQLRAWSCGDGCTWCVIVCA